MRASPVRSGLNAVVGVLVVSAAVAWPANAQPERRVEGGPGGGGMMMRMGGFGGGRNFMEPPVSSADLERYAKILALTPEQLETAKVLLEASLAEFQPAAREAREKMEQIREEARETRDFSVFRGMGEVMREFGKTRTEVEKAFMGDLQVLLSEEQMQQWPRVERTHRREQTLGRGLMGGERVDLIELVEEMELSAQDRASIGAVLDQYEMDLDRELVKRNEVYDQGQERAQELMEGFQNGDMTEAQEMFAKGREASKRVKEVNQRYARQLESLLPEDKRSAFVDRYKRESYPMIYRETYASRVLGAAEKIEGLDETQRSSIAALRAGYDRDLAAINAKLEAATEERENTADMMQMWRRGGDGDELRTSRRELETTTVQRVRDLLTEAQREQLPAREEAREGEGMRMERMEGQRRRRGGDDEREGERPRRRGGRQNQDNVPATPPPPEPR